MKADSSKVNISIIICTYNRCESLKKTLASLMAQEIPEDISYEVLVVDNNSSDKTKEVVEEFKAKYPGIFRYIFEKNQGLSFARNAGIREAKGKIVAFTDDDVLVDKYWLVNIEKAFKEHPVACIGGKILPLWETMPSEWLTKKLYSYLALLDEGNEPIFLDWPKIWGANFAVRSSVFKKYGQFNTSLGRTPGKLYAHEESRFIKKLIENEEKALYAPDIIVHHFIPVQRMCKNYFRKWKFDEGELDAISMGEYVFRKILNVPLFMIKKAMKQLLKYIHAALFSPTEVFHEELEFIYYSGFIWGRLKLRG